MHAPVRHEEKSQVDVLLLVWSTPLSSFNDVQESLASAKACRKLWEACQEPLLWRQHAFLLEYIQRVDEQQWKMPSQANDLRHFNWQLFVKLNVSCRSWVMVRLGSFDIRLPLYRYSFRDTLSTIKSLCFLLRKILAELPGSWPFRLRWLQWGGRPGRLLDRFSVNSLLSGSRLLLELAESQRSWALPPHIFHAGVFFYMGELRGVSPWQTRQRQGYLLRVISTLLPEERWLQLPADSDVWNLIEQLCILLRHESHLASTSRPLHFQLADMQASLVDPDSRTDGHPLLWDLAWCQCETIHVEVEKEMRTGGDGEVLVVEIKRETQLGEMKPANVVGDGGSFALEGVEAEEPFNTGKELTSERETEAGPAVERIVPHSPVLFLPGTQKCRQFEFHPNQPDVLLIGDTDGAAKIIQTGPEAILLGPATQVDSTSLLALSWLRHCPEIAVCGASCSGSIQFLRYFPESRNGPALAIAGSVKEKFPKLSSLSVNCSDNFLLTSGISSSISVFDIVTGMTFSKGSGVHNHFINTSRFSNSSPHIFATASFDHTCKIWDLRRPLRNPVKTLRTGHNVMCTFSPDDRYFLSSGVDTRITQFEVATWQARSMPLRKAVHKERYRRSAYLANSKVIVTGSTEESHLHLLSVYGKKLGCIDFRSKCLQARKQNRERRPDLIRGTVVLDDSDPLPSGSSRSQAFVQSVRAHPVITNRLGVLMALPEGQKSSIALVDVDAKEVR